MKKIKKKKYRKKYKIQNSGHYSNISPARTLPIYFPIQNEPRLVRNAPQRAVSVDTRYKYKYMNHFTNQFLKIDTNTNINKNT